MRNSKTNKADTMHFVKPTFQEVEALCMEKGYLINAKRFYEERERRGWISKKGEPIKDWKAALSNAAYRHKMAISAR